MIARSPHGVSCLAPRQYEAPPVFALREPLPGNFSMGLSILRESLPADTVVQHACTLTRRVQHACTLTRRVAWFVLWDVRTLECGSCQMMTGGKSGA